MAFPEWPTCLSVLYVLSTLLIDVPKELTCPTYPTWLVFVPMNKLRTEMLLLAKIFTVFHNSNLISKLFVKDHNFRDRRKVWNRQILLWSAEFAHHKFRALHYPSFSFFSKLKCFNYDQLLLSYGSEFGYSEFG